jgi:group I intron endonuclease
MECRWKGHLKEVKRGKPNYFYRSIKKHGSDCWLHSILEQCETFELANNAEAKWIAELDTKNTGYNMTDGGDGCNNLTEETRKKISEAAIRQMTPEFRKWQSERVKKQMTPEARKYLSEINTGEKHPQFGIHQSDERKQKLSESHKGEKNPMFGKPSSRRLFSKETDIKIYKAYMNGQRLCSLAKEYNTSHTVIKHAVDRVKEATK